LVKLLKQYTANEPDFWQIHSAKKSSHIFENIIFLNFWTYFSNLSSYYWTVVKNHHS